MSYNHIKRNAASNTGEKSIGKVLNYISILSFEKGENMKAPQGSSLEERTLMR